MYVHVKSLSVCHMYVHVYSGPDFNILALEKPAIIIIIIMHHEERASRVVCVSECVAA